MDVLSRRDLLVGTGAAALAALAPLALRPARGQVMGPGAGEQQPTVLQAIRRVIDVGGRAASVFRLQQPDGTWGLTKMAGDDFHVQLQNLSGEPTLVHWHGLLPPFDQDGVPGISQPPLANKQTYVYRFPQWRAGTFWMHSHFGLQEQDLMAAPLIVRDPAESGLDEQEVVILLHDFSFRSPEEIRADLASGTSQRGAAMAGMPMGGAAGGGVAMHANDVEYDAFLANDRTLADPEVVRVDPGGRVRLRVINAASSTNFHIYLGGLVGTLIAVDEEPVEPLRVRRVPLAMAQRADIRITLPAGEGAYPILALRERARQRTGLILATARAPVARIAEAGDEVAPLLDLSLERALRATRPLTERRPDRVHTVDLTGDMESYTWGMNGRPYGRHVSPEVVTGERVEVVLRNRTAMAHPMHLHGHRFQIAAIDGSATRGAMRDTVVVLPGQSVAFQFDAENWGPWAFHCHNLYHMMAGMMTTVEYRFIH
jgi:FtsP/CotA-like multicopper oxidase with cupredoxin domain